MLLVKIKQLIKNLLGKNLNFNTKDPMQILKIIGKVII